MAKSGILSLGSPTTAGLRNVQFSFQWTLTNQNAVTATNTISWKLTCTNGYSVNLVLNKNTSKYNLLTISSAANNYEYDITSAANIEIPTNTTKTLAQGTCNINQTGDVDESFKAWLDCVVYNQSTDKTLFLNDWGASDSIDKIELKAVITNYPQNMTDESPFTFYYSNPTGANAISLKAGLSLNAGDTNMEVPYRDIPKTASSYTFSLSESEFNALYKVLDAKVTSAKLRLFLKSTYAKISGTGNETVTEYVDIILNFINYKPTLNIQLEDTSLRSLDVTGNNQIFVKHVSDIHFKLNSAVRKGATLKNLWIQNGDNLITMDDDGYLSEITSDTFYAYIEDNRGYFSSYEIKWPNFIDYFFLTCAIKQSLLAANGTITITISGKYFEGSFGAKENTMRMEYLIRPDGSDSQQWAAIRYIDPTVDTEGNYSYTFDITGLNYTTRYQLFVRVIDEVMTDTMEANTIVSATPVFDWGKNDFAFYVPVTINQAAVPSIIDEWFDGTWTYRKWSNGMAECWAKVQFTTNISSAWGNMYSSGAITATNLQFPFTFTSTPIVIASLSVISAAAILMPPGGTSYTTTTKQTGAYELVRPNALNNGTYLINYYVRGYWN